MQRREGWRHVNDRRRQGERKVLAFENVVHLLGTSVECFVKVHIHVHSMSSNICDMLIPRLWWRKAPMWFFFVNPGASSARIRMCVFRSLKLTVLMHAMALHLPQRQDVGLSRVLGIFAFSGVSSHR